MCNSTLDSGIFCFVHKQSGRRTGKPDAAAAAGSVVLTQTDYSSAKYLMVRTIWLV